MRKAPSEGKVTVRTKDRVEFRIIAQTIRRLRRKIGKSQEALSAEIGMDRAYISKIETYVVNPDIATLFDIFDALEVDTPSTIAKIRQTAARRTSKVAQKKPPSE